MAVILSYADSIRKYWALAYFLFQISAFRSTIFHLVTDPSTRVQNNARELPERNSKGQEDDHGRTEVKVNLPKVQLPIFDGKISEWQEFWDIFLLLDL